MTLASEVVVNIIKVKWLPWRLWYVNRLNNRSNANGNNNLDNNNGRLVGIAKLINARTLSSSFMSESLFRKLCSYKNLERAFQKARKRKTLRSYVIEFEKDLRNNLLKLQKELLNNTYKPKPLETFILRDPKTRKISKSDFRDRVIHHALCNLIEPIFDKTFIFDSYANRKLKGTLKAVQRVDYFKRKVSKNNTRTCYVLKADIKYYFETVDHEILISIIKKKIKDKGVINLIKIILSNYKTKIENRGMPLGNLTSQFFANLYLNELDQFAKQKLKAKYYIRYVDDFIILHHSRKTLKEYQSKIDDFLREKLNLELHPDKSRILKLNNGISFLGYRIFYYHRLIRRKNINKFERKFKKLKQLHKEKKINREIAMESLEGWLAFISHANAYKYKRDVVKRFNKYFPIESYIKIKNPKKHENFIKKSRTNNVQFSSLKTLQLLRNGLNVKEIAKRRDLKESTIWTHFVRLIEHNQLLVFEIIPKKRVYKILSKIKNETYYLREIKERLNDESITFDEISCVLAYIKFKKY
ncbi:MAG: reverse transcriptase domain-containing protein [Nanoarchaeota archaeon]|nr:helix-turn-helix domain-containing protein [Nanoarchaeota archaeon]MBU1445489.1 helix-turn-helix domain-containing protein [Nanoarchaeota archaeon]MBU2420699.1 helix-turn-helix domain-containing protein [Nanoarchaeota archaeon]MBU2475660.1 helix-turn-helix domain-containing protein [Nanoarchaeota archaeon]